MTTHTCPWWVGWLLVTPLRRLKEDPSKILRPYVREGMLVLEPGPAMGFFTLELARRVGPEGHVVAIDLQPRMLATLRRRAQRAGLAERIETRCCGQDDLGVDDLSGRVDFALLFHMVHEVSDQLGFFRSVHAALKLNGTALFVEPRGHVKAEAFHASVRLAVEQGFEIAEPVQGRSPRILLRRAATGLARPKDLIHRR